MAILIPLGSVGILLIYHHSLRSVSCEISHRYGLVEPVTQFIVDTLVTVGNSP